METARSCQRATPKRSGSVPGVLRSRWNICRRPYHLNSTLLLIWILFVSTSSLAADRVDLPRLSDRATISLVTYSPGDELYTAFGHSSIRVRDDAQEIDRLYNYGTFDFETEAFYLKFVRGDLLYQLSVGLSNAEISERGSLGQGITESILNFNAERKTYYRKTVSIDTIFSWITAQRESETFLSEFGAIQWPIL